MMDAATITAIGTAVAAVLAAIGALVKIVVSRPRMPVAEELLEQIDELRADVLALARWAHRARAQAAAAGVDLEEPPEVLHSGERETDQRGAADAHGWRSSVRAQTGPQPIVDATGPIGHRQRGPDTRPERRQRPTPPPMRG